MIFRTHFLPVILCAGSMLLAQPLRAQSPSPQTWDLPHGTAVKDSGPRVYHFSVIYYSANRTGDVIHRQQVTGDYTRGLPNGDVEWNERSRRPGRRPRGSIPRDTPKLDFMQGFRYRNDIGATMSPDFFKSFPPSAVMERNLVWDTGMFEAFAENYFDQLKLNVPLHTGQDQEVKMPDVGTFRNRDVVLEYVGRSQTQRPGLRSDRLPRLLQPAPARHRRRHHPGPQRLLGRDLGLPRHQADRVRHHQRGGQRRD
jgi:hypothetical protein